MQPPTANHDELDPLGFIFPGERSRIPAEVMTALLDRLRAETSRPAPAERLCRGPLLSWRQYLVDLERWGYTDARLAEGLLTPREIDTWTEAFRDR